MNGILSQLVTLASAANGVLAGRFDSDTFYPGHPDFKSCNSVRFVDLKSGWLRKPREVERHQDPNAWLRSLRGVDAVHVWLTFTAGGTSDAPDHQLAAFVGGCGDWQLVVATPGGAEFWMARWDVTNQRAADNRIWSVTYGCVGKSAYVVNVPEPDLDTAASRLFTALNGTREFAMRHEFGSWAAWFQRALDCFDATKPIVFPDDITFICLPSYPDLAQRLFAAAYSGWVFGGMGSWNDLCFERDSDNDRYHDLSAELYAAINDAIQQATWSFGAGGAA